MGGGVKERMMKDGETKKEEPIRWSKRRTWRKEEASCPSFLTG